jgi:hypothetical protein
MWRIEQSLLAFITKCFATSLLGLTLWIADSPISLAESRDVAACSQAIDVQLEQSWAKASVTPAEIATDEEFLRRASLDLSGRTPYVAEVRSFLADTAPDKRQSLIKQRLADPAYVRHFTNVWRAILLTQASAQDLRYLTPQLEAWLQTRVRENTPYDQLVREILTTPLGDRIATSALTNEAPTPLAFYQANELKPENLASAASRVFLGVNLECAQCHNHPFARWKQDEFWQFAGFFAGVQRLRPDNALAAAPELFDRHSMQIPGTDRTVSARFLDGSEPTWSADSRSRELLANWTTSPENPYFARAVVNRLWAHFFGRGIVDPLDELGGNHPPSHPELLDTLAREFVAAGYDVKFMLRAITGSRAYQLSSRLTDDSQLDPKQFARMISRGLTPEQRFDSFVVATGCSTEHRADILAKFTSLERPAESQTSVLQALATMNGRLTSSATSAMDGPTLAAVIDAPFMNTREKITTLFLATVSRPPESSELERMMSFVDRAANDREALSDIFWALLNSADFALNH